jgi:hypothetical protein
MYRDRAPIVSSLLTALKRLDARELRALARSLSRLTDALGASQEREAGDAGIGLVHRAVARRRRASECREHSDGHAGDFVYTSAQMEWSAVVADYEFVSAPLSTSKSDFAEIGHEQNGVFLTER